MVMMVVMVDGCDGSRATVDFLDESDGNVAGRGSSGFFNPWVFDDKLIGYGIFAALFKGEGSGDLAVGTDRIDAVDAGFGDWGRGRGGATCHDGRVESRVKGYWLVGSYEERRRGRGRGRERE
jgi:hypothetical protein